MIPIGETPRQTIAARPKPESELCIAALDLAERRTVLKSPIAHVLGATCLSDDEALSYILKIESNTAHLLDEEIRPEQICEWINHTISTRT